MLGVSLSLKERFYIHSISCPHCTPNRHPDSLKNQTTFQFQTFEDAEEFLKDIQNHPAFVDCAFAREYPEEYGEEYNGQNFYTKSEHFNKNTYH
jgi:hypothetical protein